MCGCARAHRLLNFARGLCLYDQERRRVMTDALEQIRTRGATTPQREQADPRQVKNRAGGFVFEISEQNRIKRFLTLGAESTYYAGQREMTLENGGVILAW